MADDFALPADLAENGLPPSMRDRVPFLLYRAAEASHHLANEMLAGVGLSARQVGILTLVIERSPMTQAALGAELQIDRTTMVELIDDLEGRGYLERRRHPSDRRAFLIHPTGGGRAVQEMAVRVLDEQQRTFLAPLSEAEREVLADLLNRLFLARVPAGSPDAADAGSPR
jgi:DNA-binding MarR family transcriptional regulator